MERLTTGAEPRMSTALCCEVRNCGLARRRLCTREQGWKRLCIDHEKVFRDAGELLAEPPPLVRLTYTQEPIVSHKIRPSDLRIHQGEALTRADNEGRCRLAGCRAHTKARGFCASPLETVRHAGRLEELGRPSQNQGRRPRTSGENSTGPAMPMPTPEPQATGPTLTVTPDVYADNDATADLSVAQRVVHDVAEAIDLLVDAAAPSGEVSVSVSVSSSTGVGPTKIEARAMGEDCVADATCHDGSVSRIVDAVMDVVATVNAGEMSEAGRRALHRDLVEHHRLPVPLPSVLRWSTRDCIAVQDWMEAGADVKDLPGALTVDLADALVAWWRAADRRRPGPAAASEVEAIDIVDELRMRRDAIENSRGWERRVDERGNLEITHKGAFVALVQCGAPAALTRAVANQVAQLQADGWLAIEQHISRAWALNSLRSLEGVIYGEDDVDAAAVARE